MSCDRKDEEKKETEEKKDDESKKKDEKKEEKSKRKEDEKKEKQNIAGAVYNQMRNTILMEEGSVISGRFEVKGIIGGGGFAQIYKAWDKVRKEDCAIKVEHESQDIRRMKLEITVLLALRGSMGIPEILAQGKWQHEDNKSHYIVMQLVGRNLSDVRRALPHKRITERTLYRAMIQVLKALSLVHGAGFLHRDLKPSNCCIGAIDCTRIYLIDYGLTRQYLDKGGIVRKPRAGVGLRGTVRYMSLDAHARQDLGPKNDLVAFLYTTIECGDGYLPWSHEKTHENIIKLKQAHIGDKLCTKQPVMTKAAEYIESLNYHSIPDYEKLLALMEECNPPDLKESEPYDWQYRHLPNGTPGGTKENVTERMAI
ncbi:non-specific serine/threonine protein kinase [Caenorhabditis elegans]|uniref:non-specific serine/threonine protein kinase n=1 Tax=Caenorhabditis elegans TaxID=6239 RepID=P91566_CAEEL|nr:Protein kinase domain-containing protein [Caenorhabditis elegans]CCD70683.1 Protein kinase domain-containing protein [Caenorhabditis elegans]|eukprot:NP_500772.1 Uncharacterized protein CELE_ZK354.6 [Caenorhabditis elegans]